MNLTPAQRCAYTPPVTDKNVIGVRSPSWSGSKPLCASRAAFSFVRSTQLWAAGQREPQGSPVLHRSSNLRSVAHPFRRGRAVTMPQLETTIMHTQAPGASAPIVNRQTAAQINPFISDVSTEDTLSSVAGLISDLGYFLSGAIGSDGVACISLGRLYLITNAMQAALLFESQHPQHLKPYAGREGGGV